MEVFKVLTEFRFDIAHAVADSKTLQTEVGRISQAADNTLLSFQRLGMGIVAQMGVGGGGVLGALGLAIKSADKFAMSQRQIANIFLSNNMFSGADGYQNAMAAAASSMEQMKRAARGFSLPVTELAQFTKLVGASLISHGLDDSTMSKSINLSRGFLKSAPTLGIDPGLAQGQLLDSVMGRANMGDTLFQRLMNETSAMKPYAGTSGAKAFNALEPAKRLDVLTNSLMQFGSNAKIIEENARSLSGQMQRLSDNFTSMFSVLRPLGKVLLEPVRQILFQVNMWLEHQGEGVVRSFAKIFHRLFRSPETFMVNLMQMKNLKKDVQGSASVLGISSMVGMVGHGLKALGITARFAHPAIAGVAAGVGLMIEVFKRMPNDPITRFTAGVNTAILALIPLGAIFLKFHAFITPLISVLGKAMGIFGFVLMILQSVSRGAAKATIFNMKILADNADKIAEFVARLQRAFELLILPINVVIEGLSEIFEQLFTFGQSDSFAISVFETFTGFIETIGEVLLDLFAGLSGYIANFFELFDMIKNLDFSNYMKRMQETFDSGYQDFVKRWDPKFNDSDAEPPVSQRITNIDKVEINNQFKENLEPDRIAFTLVEQLQRAALNPTRATGGGFRGPQLAR